MFQFILFFAILLLVFLFAYIYLFNSLQSIRQKVEEARSMIDTQLKRRYDLVPALVETVKGYSKHESSTLEDIVKLRNNINTTTSLNEKSNLDISLTNSIKQLFVSVEAYPDLKANTNFLDLQKNLVEIEDSIQYARRYYNGAVREHNRLISTFPGILLTLSNKAKPEEYFAASNEEKTNKEVKF